ncbi:MAG: hypothetical protein K0Q66_2145 [Chitinophagaceae bacterium]|jgi:uncharacterized small protein (DUF1192 family)|nr:hypothetical protein [Chitinophagaceae bacterium]
MEYNDDYIKIGMLTNEYLDLNKEFIEAIKADKPAAVRSALKERIRVVLEEIEKLEAERSAKSNDKDELPIV